MAYYVCICVCGCLLCSFSAILLNNICTFSTMPKQSTCFMSDRSFVKVQFTIYLLLIQTVLYTSLVFVHSLIFALFTIPNTFRCRYFYCTSKCKHLYTILSLGQSAITMNAGLYITIEFQILKSNAVYSLTNHRQCNLSKKMKISYNLVLPKYTGIYEPVNGVKGVGKSCRPRK